MTGLRMSDGLRPSHPHCRQPQGRWQESHRREGWKALSPIAPPIGPIGLICLIVLTIMPSPLI